MTDEPRRCKDLLHGVTLEAMLTALVARHGWAELSRRIPIRCFFNEPSVKSSLKFLRRTPWAREKVEALYVEDRKREARPDDLNP
ncbi:MAG: DUF2132 domain-containing protein [Proteobacteria bacterium]|jgi:uncharacterized protein (DUF2132 family)|nr:DUF2132 domain-containing protein [Pseudomonadota bacterium]